MAIKIHMQYQGIMGVLYGVWWSTTMSIIHFYMASISAVSYSISEAMTGLNSAIQKILPEKYEEGTALEENRDEDVFRTLKRVEDAYEELCDCCFTLNEVFGFSVSIIISAAFLYNLLVVYIVSRNLKYVNVLSGSHNSLQLWVSFYALTVVAASCESIHNTARDLYRCLALLNSELQRGDKSLELQVLARDVLQAVRVRQPRLSACGLFDLRMTLVTAFLSLTATYSIILLQFTNFL